MLNILCWMINGNDEDGWRGQELNLDDYCFVF